MHCLRSRLNLKCCCRLSREWDVSVFMNHTKYNDTSPLNLAVVTRAVQRLKAPINPTSETTGLLEQRSGLADVILDVVLSQQSSAIRWPHAL